MLLHALFAFYSNWGLGEDTIWRPEVARCYYLLLYALLTFLSDGGLGEYTIWRPEMARCYYMLYLPLIQTGGWGRTPYGDLRWLDATICLINLCFRLGVGGYTIWRPEVARCYYMLYLPLIQNGGWGSTQYGDLRWLDATSCYYMLY